ncbi:MAG: hypothetical protein RSA94_01760 [Mucinivorans sp.]
MTVSQIIERELLGSRAVALPFVGTLRVELCGARFVSGRGGAMVPPRRQVVLSADFQPSASIIDTMASYGGQSLSEAMTIEEATLYYNQWVESASSARQGVLLIDGVCRISMSDFSFTLDERFARLLDPAADVAQGAHPEASVEAWATMGNATPSTPPSGRPYPKPVAGKGSGRRSLYGPSSVVILFALLLVLASIIYVAYFFLG